MANLLDDIVHFSGHAHLATWGTSWCHVARRQLASSSFSSPFDYHHHFFLPFVLLLVPLVLVAGVVVVVVVVVKPRQDKVTARVDGDGLEHLVGALKKLGDATEAQAHQGGYQRLLVLAEGVWVPSERGICEEGGEEEKKVRTKIC